MVEGLAEFVGELVVGLGEGVLEWFANGGHDGGTPDRDDDDALSRYANSLYEQRPPPGVPQDLN